MRVAKRTRRLLWSGHLHRRASTVSPPCWAPVVALKAPSDVTTVCGHCRCRAVFCLHPPACSRRHAAPCLSCVVATLPSYPLLAQSVRPPASFPTPASPGSRAVNAACHCNGTENENTKILQLQNWCCVNRTSSDLLSIDGVFLPVLDGLGQFRCHGDEVNQ